MPLMRLAGNIGEKRWGWLYLSSSTQTDSAVFSRCPLFTSSFCCLPSIIIPHMKLLSEIAFYVFFKKHSSPETASFPGIWFDIILQTQEFCFFSYSKKLRQKEWVKAWWCVFPFRNHFWNLWNTSCLLLFYSYKSFPSFNWDTMNYKNICSEFQYQLLN